MASHSPSPSTGIRAPPAPEGRKESVIARLFIAPLTFISFLLSLALIDSRNHAHRSNSHPRSQTAPKDFSARIKAFFQPAIYKFVDSPYTYLRSPEKDIVNGMHEGEGVARRDGEERWYWHTQQKKMMKAEVADAFRVRKWVALGLVVLFGAVCGLVYGVSRWISRLVWG